MVVVSMQIKYLQGTALGSVLIPDPFPSLSFSLPHACKLVCVYAHTLVFSIKFT